MRVYKKLSASSGGGGGGGGTTTKYIQTFNATSDWSLASPYYVISISASTHGAGTDPIVTMFELVASSYEEVDIDRIQMDSSGNVQLRVTNTARFAGKLVII